MNTVLLFVPHGTTSGSFSKIIEIVEQTVHSRFGEYEVRWSYSSEIVRKKLNILLSLEDEIVSLLKNGYKIVMQSLHVIPGKEYLKVRALSEKYAIPLGKPLISSMDDLEKVLDLFLKTYNRPLLFASHGSTYGKWYTEANDFLKDTESFMALIEGKPGIDDAISKFSSEVLIVPFLAVAGNHFNKDICGTWVKKLESNGISTSIVKKGLLEHVEIVQLWMNHLQKVLEIL